MKTKQFKCAVVPPESMSVALTSTREGVAVWYTGAPNYAVHMPPDEAIRMATHILKAAEKAKKNG